MAQLHLQGTAAGKQTSLRAVHVCPALRALTLALPGSKGAWTWMAWIGVKGPARKCTVTREPSTDMLQRVMCTGCACCSTRNARSTMYSSTPARTRGPSSQTPGT